MLNTKQGESITAGVANNNDLTETFFFDKELRLIGLKSYADESGVTALGLFTLSSNCPVQGVTTSSNEAIVNGDEDKSPLLVVVLVGIGVILVVNVCICVAFKCKKSS